MSGLEFHDSRNGHVEEFFVDSDVILPVMRAAANRALCENVPSFAGRFVLSDAVAKRLECEMDDLRTLYAGKMTVDGGTFCGYEVEVIT